MIYANAFFVTENKRNSHETYSILSKQNSRTTIKDIYQEMTKEPQKLEILAFDHMK